MSAQTTVGAPDPDTLLQSLQGQSITQGWDVVSAMSVEQINNLLAQQYVTKLASGDDLPPINGTVSIIENMSAQFIDVVLGSPLIQFSPSLDPQEANLTLNFISGTINTVQVQAGVSTILTSQTILPGDNYTLTGVVPLAPEQGEVDNTQHNVIIDIANAKNFTANLSFPSGAETVLGTYFLTLLQNAKLSYTLGTLQYPSSATGLTPVIFHFATQIDQDDSTDTGRLLLFIATAYSCPNGAATCKGGSQTSLSVANIVPYNYSTTLIVSSQILFQDILLPAFQTSLASASPTLTATLSEPSNPNSNYVLNFTGGSFTFDPVEYQENDSEGDLYATGVPANNAANYDPQSVVTPLNPLQVAPNNNNIVVSGQPSWSQNWIHLYTPPREFPRSDSGAVTMTANVSNTSSGSITSDSKSNQQDVSFSSDPSVTVSFDHSDTWQKVFVGDGISDKLGNMIASEAQSKLQSAFGFTLPSISTFAVSNLLFPGQNILNFQEANVPGDLVIFGQIRSTTIETAPLQVTLTDAQTQQFTAQLNGLTLPSGDVTWSLSSKVGSISSTGLYTAPTTITNSQTILATATTTQGNQVAQSAVTLVPSGILISPSVVIVPNNSTSTQQFEAVVAGTGSQSIAWSVSSAGGSITSAGIYTPPATGTTPTAVTVTATSTTNSSEQGTALVVLMQGVTLEGIGVSPAMTASPLTPAQTQQFTASGGTGVNNASVTWSLTPNVGTISDGLYTAPSTIDSPQTVVVLAGITDPILGDQVGGIAIINLVPSA